MITSGLQRVAVTTVTVVMALFGSAAATRAEPIPPAGPPQAFFTTAFAYSLLNPTASPPGANDWSCKPSALHPNPVVLSHGTAENAYDNWAGLAPVLKADGYCVFAPNVGGTANSPFQAMGPIAETAAQFGAYIDKVIAATGASKVDVVGHSQGGMMPRYYIKNLGGANKVGKLVALAPSNHGTTANGILPLISLLPGGQAALGLPCTACVEQRAGSAFLNALNTPAETDPRVTYTVIATTFDQVVTPYTSSFLTPGPNVFNTTVQNYCALDFNEHIRISYDPIAHRLVRNALDPRTARTPNCFG